MIIHLEHIRSSQELHQVLKEHLRIPHFYGMNWDAFWDAITGLVHMPEELVLIGFDDLTHHLPDEAAILKKIAEEYNELGMSRISLQ